MSSSPSQPDIPLVMELAGAPYEQTSINISGATAGDTSTVGRLSSEDTSSLKQIVPAQAGGLFVDAAAAKISDAH